MGWFLSLDKYTAEDCQMFRDVEFGGIACSLCKVMVARVPNDPRHARAAARPQAPAVAGPVRSAAADRSGARVRAATYPSPGLAPQLPLATTPHIEYHRLHRSGAAGDEHVGHRHSDFAARERSSTTAAGSAEARPRCPRPPASAQLARRPGRPASARVQRLRR